MSLSGEFRLFLPHLLTLTAWVVTGGAEVPRYRFSVGKLNGGGLKPAYRHTGHSTTQKSSSPCINTEGVTEYVCITVAGASHQNISWSIRQDDVQPNHREVKRMVSVSLIPRRAPLSPTTLSHELFGEIAGGCSTRNVLLPVSFLDSRLPPCWRPFVVRPSYSNVPGQMFSPWRRWN